MMLLGCVKDESLNQKIINNPKEYFNNTSNWKVIKYTENYSDSTKIFSKYFVSFNEDDTCAEIVQFNAPLARIQGIWEIYQYADGTTIKFWITDQLGFHKLQGEWYFNELTSERIHIFRIDNQNKIQELVFVR